MTRLRLIGLCITVAGCAGSSPSADSARSNSNPTGAPSEPAAVSTVSTVSTGVSEVTTTTVASEAARVLHPFASAPDLVDEDFRALNSLVRNSPGEVRDAAIERLRASDPNLRYAAVYGLALTADDADSIAALVPIVTSSDISERMLAAGSLISRGERSAFPILIDALDSGDPLAFRDPPQRAWQFVRFVLIQYTEEDMGLLGPRTFSTEQAAAAKPTWETWWSDHGDACSLTRTTACTDEPASAAVRVPGRGFAARVRS